MLAGVLDAACRRRSHAASLLSDAFHVKDMGAEPR